MYTIVRNAPPPTFEQLGREIGCCRQCKSEQEKVTKILPISVTGDLEKLALLNLGDALDTSKKNRNILGDAVLRYDKVNKTKHEIFMQDENTVRCWRLK